MSGLTKAIKTADVQEIEQYSSNATNLAQQFVIEDASTLATATDMLAELSKYDKQLKSKKEAVTKPLNEALKNYRAMFKPIEEDLAAGKSALKAKMVEYERKVEAERLAKMEKIEARVERGTMRPDTAIRKASELDTVDNTVYGDTGKATFTTVKVVEVEDWSKVPAYIWTHDNVRKAAMVEIRRLALGNKSQGIEPVEIPGVVVKEEKTVY